MTKRSSGVAGARHALVANPLVRIRRREMTKAIACSETALTAERSLRVVPLDGA